MGREVRRVAIDWVHPKSAHGNYDPLFEGFAETKQEFDIMVAEKGIAEANDWFGSAPMQKDYMPDWTEDEATHYMMYETCSEGTPISPAFETPEELARWLFVNHASAFAGQTASYDAWLRIANGGYAPSAILSMSDGVIQSGVEALKND